MESAMTSLQNAGSNLLDRVAAAPVKSGFITLFATAAIFTVVDYQAWLAFGTGGTPPTFRGYMRMTGIRMRALMGKEDLTDPSSLNTESTKYLSSSLNNRPGKRPKIMSRTMPQRQWPEPITSQASARLEKLIESVYEKHKDLLEYRPSKTEGGSTDAIYAKESLTTLDPQVKSFKFLGREIAHVHPADRSLHVWLSEADAHEVIRSGWGERFPAMFIPNGNKIASPGWTMVYAPRDDADVDVVEKIVFAGVGYVTGVNVSD